MVAKGGGGRRQRNAREREGGGGWDRSATFRRGEGGDEGRGGAENGRNTQRVAAAEESVV